jgi:hypothetical protein
MEDIFYEKSIGLTQIFFYMGICVFYLIIMDYFTIFIKNVESLFYTNLGIFCNAAKFLIFSNCKLS